MQQEVGGRMEQMNGLQQQRQDRRVKPPGSENQQPHQPQKCPRCESLNTKFCYYNNYSLTQPRYFCKTCRRYWTQGGTLRNVPVGGGCRKGKRSKRPSTAENQNLKQQLVSVSAATASNATVVPKAETDVIMGSSNPIPSIAPASSSMYYPGGGGGGGGGFLSSLATLQPFNQAMNLGGDFGGSNLALLQGFGLPSLQQHLQQSQVFDMDGRGTNPSQVFPQAENIIQGSGDSRTTSHHQDWNQSFIKSEPAYWANSNRDSNNTGGDGGGGGGGSSIRSQSWMSDPPGYDPSSQPFL